MATKPAAPVSSKPSPAMRAAFDRLMEVRGSSPFRQLNVENAVYPHTNPRSHDRAKAVAQVLKREAAKAGKIERTGHLHWKQVTASRTLASGRKVGESSELSHLTLDTRCPEKWVAVDLESGNVWIGSGKGWKAASETVRAEAGQVLLSASRRGSKPA